MYYSDIKPNDVINGKGICVSLFVSGCENYCEDCFNKETWNFNYGQKFTNKNMDYILECIPKNNTMRNFSVLGGEPLHKKNIITVLEILKEVKDKYPNITTYVWTGYLFEDLLKEYKKYIFKDIDILIDGKFEKDKKDLRLKLRGSSNQRIIDIQKTLKEDKVIEII